MTEIEKAREWRLPGKSMDWFLVFSAIVMASMAVAQTPHQTSVFATGWVVGWTAILFFLAAYQFQIINRRLHKELVQELDTLRQELAQLKKNP